MTPIELMAAAVRRLNILRQFCLAWPLALLIAGQLHAADAFSDRLRNRVEASVASGSATVLDEHLLAAQTLRRLYVDNAYQPLWVDETGPTAQAERFLAWLAAEPRRHGLRPAHYHVRVLEMIEDSARAGALVDFELAMSDAFLLLGSHLLAGRLDPESLDPEWRANRRHRDLVPIARRAASMPDPGDALADLLPDDPDYARLVDELDRLRKLDARGGWEPVSAGPTLRPGDRDSRVGELARRLRASGDYDGQDTDDFSDDLAAAVARFQARHGLTPDGIVGKATLAALNVSVADRIDQVIVNLERWRWLPEELGARHVRVNIASYRLDVFDAGASILSMRVIVGRPYRRTPVFSGNISYLVLNPYWEVPTSIAVKDKLPLIKADPGYLEQNGFTLLDGWGGSERVIDPATVNWGDMTPKTFRYRLRQAPGPGNALGRVKFMFPNEFAVYLHDTPARELFAREARTFSSGCIRVERPIELADLLLEADARWTRREIESVLESRAERSIVLPAKVPVHLLYWTAWVDDDGVMQFRDDIYRRDVPILSRLRDGPPTD